MTLKQAHRRYMTVFIPSMLIYVISCFTVETAIEKNQFPLAVSYALALIPAACMLVWMWGHWRFVREIDEYLRWIQIQAVLVGLACIMSISAGLGFLQLMADVPYISLFWIVPGFYFAYGIAAMVLGWRAGHKSWCL